jgi:hypothetical protein
MNIAAISPELRKFSKTLNPEPSIHLGQRYNRHGKFLREPGNTVVCHLIEESETENALVEARARYSAMPEAGHLAFTPVSSLHMTLFQGIIEYRRHLPYWPVGVALDTPIDEMTAIFLDRLQSFSGGPAFRVRVTDALPTGLVVEGANEADRKALKEWRNAFANIFGYRHPDHASYEFHITFAYVIEKFADATLPAWQGMLRDVAREINDRVGVLELRPPAFCAFNDMNHFEELCVFEFR